MFQIMNTVDMFHLVLGLQAAVQPESVVAVLRREKRNPSVEFEAPRSVRADARLQATSVASDGGSRENGKNYDVQKIRDNIRNRVRVRKSWDEARLAC